LYVFNSLPGREKKKKGTSVKKSPLTGKGGVGEKKKKKKPGRCPRKEKGGWIRKRHETLVQDEDSDTGPNNLLGGALTADGAKEKTNKIKVNHVPGVGKN